MNLYSAVGSYGDGVLNILAERMSIGGASVQGAWMRPNEDPIDRKLDVTRGFSSIMQSHLMLTDQPISPQELVDLSCIRPAAYKLGKLFGVLMGRNERRGEPVSGNWWLCVSFVVPGGSRYTCCYLIPKETVTFPPQMGDSARMLVPLCRQVTFAGILADALRSDAGRNAREEQEEEEEEKEPIVILDITKCVVRMVGPDGSAFGRKWMDARLAVADALDECSNPTAAAKRFATHMSGPAVVSTVVDTADGTRSEVPLGGRLEFAVAAVKPENEKMTTPPSLP
jgi:hypothetical protein